MFIYRSMVTCTLTFLVDLIHDARHLCKRLRTDGIKSTSCGFSGGQTSLSLPIQEIAVEFVYSMQQKIYNFSS